MRKQAVRGVAIAAGLVLVVAGCSSSSHKGDNSPTTVFPTSRIPTSVPAGATTRPSTTVKASATTTSSSTVTTTSTPGATTVPTVAATTTTQKAGPPGTVAAGIVFRWKLGLDFRTHPGHNPFSDSQNSGPAVWSLRQGYSLSRNGLYPLLPSFSSTFESDGLSAWHADSAGCPKLPAIGINIILDAQIPQCSATIAGGAAFLEPSVGHPAIVGWTSPFTGLADISHDAVADLDGTCGDGISYYVDLGTQQIRSARITNGNSATLPDDRVRVVKGQTLYFIVDPGPADDASCDATQVEVTIDQRVG